MTKTIAGNFFEDFRIGQTIRHATPRTITTGDVAIYNGLFGARFAVQSSDAFAKAIGYPRSPIDDLLVFHIVFGKTVPDISLNAVANLGYANCRFLAPVYPGDTLSAVSEVIGLKENSSRKTGIVFVRAVGYRSDGTQVLEDVRWVMVRKRDEQSDVTGEHVPRLPTALDPKMLARMLDELDRAMSDEGQKGEDANQPPSSQSAQNGKSEDDNNQNSSQQSSPDGKQSAAQMASMQEAARQLAEQMNRQRSQGRQSTAASRMTSNSADTKAAPPSAVRVLDVDRRSGEDWGKLREQSAEDTVESTRQTVAPQYRQSVETYFRVLSERGHRSGQP